MMSEQALHELIRQLEYLRDKHYDVTRIYFASLAEEMHAATDKTGALNDDVSAIYKDAAERLSRQIDQLEQMLLRNMPHAEFIEQFGGIAHLLYRERYPQMTGRAKIERVNVGDRFDWSYILPSPDSWLPGAYGDYPEQDWGLMEQVARMGKRSATVQFEQWLTSRGIFYFAFAPEIDTIFWRAKEQS